MKRVLDFFLDKVLRLLFFFEFPPSKETTYNYERDFLGVADYGKGLAEIYKPITEKIEKDIDKIYNIKTSIYHNSALIRIKYCIENGFWGLFSLVLYDGYALSNDIYFDQNLLITYLIVINKNEKYFVIVKSRVKHFEVIELYKKTRVSIKIFKDRQLVYSKEKGFVSL